MYIFEIGEMVYYTGDSSAPPRNNRSLAFIDKIDDSKFPWVGIRLWPSNDLVSVHYNLIRSINTKTAHLIKLGFQKKEQGGIEYFEKNGVFISAFSFPIKTSHLYIAGFRIVPHIPFVINLDKYLISDSTENIDNNKFNFDFPEANNLNYLLKILRAKGMNAPDIESFDELMPNY